MPRPAPQRSRRWGGVPHPRRSRGPGAQSSRVLNPAPRRGCQPRAACGSASWRRALRRRRPTRPPALRLESGGGRCLDCSARTRSSRPSSTRAAPPPLLPSAPASHLPVSPSYSPRNLFPHPIFLPSLHSRLRVRRFAIVSRRHTLDKPYYSMLHQRRAFSLLSATRPLPRQPLRRQPL